MTDAKIVDLLETTARVTRAAAAVLASSSSADDGVRAVVAYSLHAVCADLAKAQASLEAAVAAAKAAAASPATTDAAGAED